MEPVFRIAGKQEGCACGGPKALTAFDKLKKAIGGPGITEEQIQQNERATFDRELRRSQTVPSPSHTTPSRLDYIKSIVTRRKS